MGTSASQLLPESALALLDQHFGGDARHAPAELIEGSTNHVVRVRLQGASYAVRVPRINTAHLEINRRSECAALDAAATASVGPRVAACDPSSGVVVTHWIDGRTWTAERAHEAEAIREMARVLRALHAIPTPKSVRSLAPLPLLGGYWRILSGRPGPLNSRLASLHARVLARASEAHRHPLALCHSDLHYHNLIENQRLWLLDWEYAGVTEPTYDLASFAQSNDLTSTEQELLLDAYGLPRADAPRFALHRLLFDWICVLWLAMVDAREGSSEGERLELLVRRVEAALESD